GCEDGPKQEGDSRWHVRDDRGDWKTERPQGRGKVLGVRRLQRRGESDTKRVFRRGRILVRKVRGRFPSGPAAAARGPGVAGVPTARGAAARRRPGAGRPGRGACGAVVRPELLRYSGLNARCP